MNTLNEHNKESNELLQLVSFKIGEEEFGVDILKVQEINKMMNITEIPNSPEFVDGIITLRGRIIPVIDLRTRLSIRRKQQDSKTRIIVVYIQGKVVGFVVDEVSEVLRISSNNTEPPPPMVLANIDNEYITSVAKLEDRLLILLDLDKVLTTEQHSNLLELEFFE